MGKTSKLMGYLGAMLAAAANSPGAMASGLASLMTPKPHRHATTPKWVQEIKMQRAEEKRARKAARRYVTVINGRETMSTLSAKELRQKGLPRLKTFAEKLEDLNAKRALEAADAIS